MYIAATIPEDVLESVRAGARGVLLEPLASLRELAEHDFESVSREHAELLVGQVVRLVGLLDVVGWSPGAAVPETTIDIEQNGLALCEALSEAMRLATVELDEAEPIAQARMRGSIAPLVAFARVVEASCEHARAHAAVFLFRGDLEALVSVLERSRSGRSGEGSEPHTCGCLQQECSVQSR